MPRFFAESVPCVRRAFTRNIPPLCGIKEIIWQKRQMYMMTKASRCSRERTGSAAVRRSFSARTDWRAASTPSLRYLSNAVDEAREGYGDKINHHRTITTARSAGRGSRTRRPARTTTRAEGKYNWELVYCELYAGGKYNNNVGRRCAYEYSLGLNGLGACRDAVQLRIHERRSPIAARNMLEMTFQKGLSRTASLSARRSSPKRAAHGDRSTYWHPDLEVFTDDRISRANIMKSMLDKVRRSSTPDCAFVFRLAERGRRLSMQNETSITSTAYRLVPDRPRRRRYGAHRACSLDNRRHRGRDRADKHEYKLQAPMIAFCFSNTVNLIEYYHNSSFLEHGGSPDKAARTAFVYAIDKYLKANGKYNEEREQDHLFGDIEDCLVLVIEQLFHADVVRKSDEKGDHQRLYRRGDDRFSAARSSRSTSLKIRPEADKIARPGACQQAQPRERRNARGSIIKRSSPARYDIANRVEKFVDCRSKDPERRELYIVEGDSAHDLLQARPRRRISGDNPGARQDAKLPEEPTTTAFSKAKSLWIC